MILDFELSVSFPIFEGIVRRLLSSITLSGPVLANEFGLKIWFLILASFSLHCLAFN